MTLHVILLAAIVVCASLAVFLTDLLAAAISLALASVSLSILFFQLGVPYAAVFELSVGAGLVMVLLVSAIGLTKRTPPENEEKGKSPVLIIPVLALLVLALIDVLVFVFMGNRIPPAQVEPASSFGETLWRVRWLDVLGQLGIILAGVFAVLALFRKEGGLIGSARHSEPADSGEPYEL